MHAYTWESSLIIWLCRRGLLAIMQRIPSHPLPSFRIFIFLVCSFVGWSLQLHLISSSSFGERKRRKWSKCPDVGTNDKTLGTRRTKFVRLFPVKSSQLSNKISVCVSGHKNIKGTRKVVFSPCLSPPTSKKYTFSHAAKLSKVKSWR